MQSFKWKGMCWEVVGIMWKSSGKYLISVIKTHKKIYTGVAQKNYMEGKKQYEFIERWKTGECFVTLLWCLIAVIKRRTEDPYELKPIFLVGCHVIPCKANNRIRWIIVLVIWLLVVYKALHCSLTRHIYLNL